MLVKTKLFNIVTPHKRGLGQGNIFTSVCQEFCSQGGCLVPGGSAPGGVSAPGRVPASGGVGGLLPGGCLVETPPGTATAAGGTHTTGMHSCCQCILVNRYLLIETRCSF